MNGITTATAFEPPRCRPHCSTTARATMRRRYPQQRLGATHSVSAVSLMAILLLLLTVLPAATAVMFGGHLGALQYADSGWSRVLHEGGDAAATSSNEAATLQPLPAPTATQQLPPDMCGQGTSGADTLLDYEYLVQCTSPLKDSLGLARVVLVVILVLLLYLLSSTADAFFCPVLQVIVEKYRIPPDIAGVTFLSFGNGSPDVFSNIAAFSLSSPNIGVASILGGGLLVTTVIAACVGLVSQGQEQLIPHKFIRDVGFYFLAVAYFCFVCFDGTVHLLEALGFIVIYSCYALVVFFDKQVAKVVCIRFRSEHQDALMDEYYDAEQVQYSESSPSSSNGSDMEHHLLMSMSYDVFRIPNYRTATVDSYDSDSSSQGLPTLHRKASAPTPRSMRQESLLERTDTYFKRPASVCVSSMKQSRKSRRRRTAWESLEASSHFGPTAHRWTRSYHHLSGIEEFPSVSETEEEAHEPLDEVDESEITAGDEQDELLQGQGKLSRDSSWQSVITRGIHKCYSAFEFIVWNPLEFATTFIRRLTIPLVDEETWDKNFAVACPPFIILVIGVSLFHYSLHDPVFVGAIVLGGGCLSALVEYTTSHEEPPEGIQLTPFVCVAFVMSVIWIMNIADEVLGVLQTLGGLFGISNSVLGVSVLAWGNSIGDLVSNTSIARDGFPTMAFAGCFAGPMFNLLVGIGLALTIGVLSNGPVSMGKPTPLVYLGFGYLFISLALNLGMAACDNFRYSKRLCYALLALYFSFAVLSIIVVIYYDEEPR
ncbi:Ca2 :cation antiporter, partial [Globisporangium splendens]